MNSGALPLLPAPFPRVVDAHHPAYAMPGGYPHYIAIPGPADQVFTLPDHSWIPIEATRRQYAPPNVYALNIGGGVPHNFNVLGGDALRVWHTGDSSDGSNAVAQAASLGRFRSATEAVRVGFRLERGIAGLSVDYVSRRNGPPERSDPASGSGGIGQIAAVTANKVRYTAPSSSTPGPAVLIANGETKILRDGADPSKWIRVSRTSANDLKGSAEVQFAEKFNNVFGQSDATKAVSTLDTYRAVMLQNATSGAGAVRIDNVKAWLDTLGTGGVVTDSAQLGATGAGTITTSTAGAFANWPFSGYARIETTGGTLREIVYYSARTATSLTIPHADARALLGTTAAAGAADDEVYPVPNCRIAYEAADGSGKVQLIPDEETAPTSVTWSTAIAEASAVSIGSFDPNDKGAIWVHREIPDSIGDFQVAIAEAEIRVILQYDVDGVTYQETLAGLWALADSSLDRYEVHIDTAEPDITSTPTETFSSLPHESTFTLTNDATNYIVKNKRNAYNLVTESIEFTRITLDASGNQISNPPSPPEILHWKVEDDQAGNYVFQLRAAYYSGKDTTAEQADRIVVYFTSDGSDPDPDTDAPAAVLNLRDADGLPYEEWTSAGFTSSTTGKVAIVAERLDGSRSTSVTSSATSPAITGGDSFAVTDGDVFFGGLGAG